MTAGKLYKKREFRHLLLAICVLWRFEKNVWKKCWHSQIESLSNIIKCALKEAKMLQARVHPSYRPTLLSCDTASPYANAHICVLCNTHPSYVRIHVHIF